MLLFELFILVLVESLLNLIVGDIRFKADLVSKVHDDDVVLRFCQELLEFSIGLDDLNGLVISHQDVLLKTDLFSQLTDLFHGAAFSSVPIGSGIGGSVIFDVQLLNVLRKLRAASSEEKPAGLQIDDVSGLVNHYIAKLAEHVDLILG